MPLQPQEIEIPLTLGMATKPSDELQEPTSMRLVQNMHWRGLGQLEARPQAVSEGSVSAPSGSVYDANETCGLIEHKGVALAVSGQHGLVQAYNGGTQWVRADTATSQTPDEYLAYAPVSYDLRREFVASSKFSNDSRGINQVCYAQYSGVAVVGWFETTSSGSTLYLKAYDAANGAVVATREYKTLSAGMALHACEYTESGKEGVVIGYIGAIASPYVVSCIRFDYATSGFIEESALTTNAALNSFCLVKYGTSILFGFKDDTSGFLTVQTRTLSTVSSTHTGNHAANYVHCVVGNSRVLVVSSTSTTAYVEVLGTPANVQTFAASSESFHSITAAAYTRNDQTESAVVAVNSVTSTSPTSTRVVTRQVNFSTTTPSLSGTNTQAHMICVSHAFTLHGAAHLVMTHGLYVNATYRTEPGSVLVARHRTDASNQTRLDVVARVCHDRYYRGNSLTAILDSGVYASGDDVWIALTADPSEYAATGTEYSPQTLFVSHILAQRPMPMPYTTTGGGTTLVAGAQPWEYDGWFATETAPMVAPIAYVDVSSGTGETAATGFGIRPMVRWVDSAGRLHRRIGAAVNTGVFTNKQVDVYVSFDGLSAHDGSTNHDLYAVELYVTSDGGSSYFLARDSGASNKLYHTSITSDGLWYKFTNLDVNGWITNIPMPFATEIEPEHPPALAHVSTISDRLWAIDAEDRSRVWYTKPLVAGYAAEWSSSCTLTIGDECVAVVDQGGFPTVLARGGLYQIAGSGPDANGNGSFAPAQRIPVAVECVDPVSVCRTPAGVFFRGRRGFYALSDGPRPEPGLLIDPEMLTDPAVDPGTSSAFRSRAVYQEQTNEVHLLTTSGERLVFNTLEQKWSKYTPNSGYTMVDLAVASGSLVSVETDGATTDPVLREALYSESGDSYNSTQLVSGIIETPWYRFDKDAGHIRLWRATASMKLPSTATNCRVTIAHYADWDDATATTSKTWSGAELAALYSGGDRHAKLQLAPARQLATAHKFKITLERTSTSTGVKPFSLRLTIGTRPSGGKQSAAESKG